MTILRCEIPSVGFLFFSRLHVYVVCLLCIATIHCEISWINKNKYDLVAWRWAGVGQALGTGQALGPYSKISSRMHVSKKIASYAEMTSIFALEF